MASARRYLLLSLTAAALTAILAQSYPLSLKNAYAHPIPDMFPIGLSNLVYIDDESISNESVNINSPNSGAFTVSGTLHNISDRPITMSIYASVYPENPTANLANNQFLYNYYPVYKDPGSWYFKVQTKPAGTFLIKPTERLPYEITLIPLKQGSYHIHTYTISDILIHNRYLDGIGGGVYVEVAGGSAYLPTLGEVLQLYLPLATGAIALFVLVLKAVKNERNGSVLKRGLRLFFAVISSMHTVWIVGLVFWFIFGAYPAISAQESRLYSLGGMIALISAITVVGCWLAISKSKRWTLVAILSAAAGFAFYFLTQVHAYEVIGLYNQVLYYNQQYNYNLPFSSGIGFPSNQLEVDPFVAFVIMISYAAAGATSAILVIKYNSSRIGRQVVSLK